ncbi:MAG: DedA family protein [Actinomycetota bacterium]|nr:DedA family protein [Actinomycetota bacterium]
MTEWATSIVSSLGVIGVAFLIAVENLFPPIPSELILPLTGFLVGRGEFSFTVALIAATAGAVGGALALYALGVWLGWDRLRSLVRRHGTWLMVTEDDVDKADRFFDRHGAKVVLFGRLAPGVRSVVSIPAGASGMGLRRFTIYTAVGSAVWNAALIGIGYALGSNWENAQSYTRYFEYGVLAFMAGSVTLFVVRRRSERTKRGRQDPSQEIHPHTR